MRDRVALAAGALNQSGEERATQTLPLPGVGDGRSDLDRTGLVEPRPISQ